MHDSGRPPGRTNSGRKWPQFRRRRRSLCSPSVLTATLAQRLLSTFGSQQHTDFAKTQSSFAYSYGVSSGFNTTKEDFSSGSPKHHDEIRADEQAHHHYDLLVA